MPTPEYLSGEAREAFQKAEEAHEAVRLLEEASIETAAKRQQEERKPAAESTSLGS